MTLLIRVILFAMIISRSLQETSKRHFIYNEGRVTTLANLRAKIKDTERVKKRSQEEAGGATPDWDLGKLRKFFELTQEMKDWIVLKHNLFRNKVAAGQETRGRNGTRPPPAQNMAEVIWDEYPAATSALLAEVCWYDHIIHAEFDDATTMGQNLGVKNTTQRCDIAKHFRRAVEFIFRAWEDESKLWDYETRPDHETGHFTQLIWHNSWKVGCTVVDCIPKAQACSWFYIACDYIKAGNLREYRKGPMRIPYVAGAQNCKAFGLLPPKRYSHLCSASAIAVKIFSAYPPLFYIIVYIFYLFI